MQRLTADAERVFEALARASAESVERDAEAVNAETACGNFYFNERVFAWSRADDQL